MDRISTASSYSQILANLMAAQVAENNAGNQLASTETATDLQGYGTGAETLTALQATTTQVTGYLNNSQTVSAKLSTQDSALTEVASGATLMTSLQDAFSSAVEGLNSTFNGEYMFAGGQVNTQPVTATSLSDLTAGPIAGVFHNDQRVASTQLDQNTSVSTGFLAGNVGTPLFQALAAIESYAQTNGPFGATLTSAQVTFLTSQIAGLDTVQANLNNVVAQNGQAQDEVSNAQSDLTQRQTMLQGLIGNITSANLAQADTNLQQAQLSIQAASQVFQALNSSSLLNTLSATPALRA